MKALLDRQELKQLLPLAIPVLITQLSQMAMGFVDTVMASRVSPVDMAAVAIGTSIWTPVILFGIGILMVLGPIVAHLHGEGKQGRISHYMNQSFWIALVLALLIMTALYYSSPLLHVISQDKELVRISSGYIHAILWGAPALLGFVSLRSLNEGMSMTKAAMVVGIIGLLVNIPANYCFVYGKLGAPALGGAGCGVATAIVYWVMFFCLLLLILRDRRHRYYRTLSFPHRPTGVMLATVLKLGLPVAFSMLCEVGLFCSTALMLAPLGTVQVAAHQVAISVSSLVFMVPLSIGTAVSIRVAHNLGSRNLEAVRTATRTGYTLGLMFAALSASIIYFGRYPIAGFYTSDPKIVSIAVILLTFCAIYQFSDACHIMGSSILRGHKDTMSIMIITVIAFWVIAVPIGYMLARTDLLVPHMGAPGFWIGAIIGLTLSAVFMGLRVRYVRRFWPQ